MASEPLLREWPEAQQILLQGVSKEDPWMLVLPCISCLAVGGVASKAVPVAAAAVALHQAARIVDAVQDNDDISTMGVDSQAAAIGLSTGLIFAAFHCLGLVETDGQVNHRLLALFSEATFHSSQGQHLSLTQGYESLEAYWRIVISKSGSLFRMSTAGGAAVGTDTQHLVDALGEYGTCLGVMLQVIDDCRDVLEDSDSAQHRVSLPLLLLAMTHEGEPGRANATPLDHLGSLSRQSLYDALHTAGVPHLISEVLLKWRQRALSSLKPLKRSDAVDALERIVQDVLASPQPELKLHQSQE